MAWMKGDLSAETAVANCGGRVSSATLTRASRAASGMEPAGSEYRWTCPEASVNARASEPSESDSVRYQTQLYRRRPASKEPSGPATRYPSMWDRCILKDAKRSRSVSSAEFGKSTPG